MQGRIQDFGKGDEGGGVGVGRGGGEVRVTGKCYNSAH